MAEEDKTEEVKPARLVAVAIKIDEKILTETIGNLKDGEALGALTERLLREHVATINSQ